MKGRRGEERRRTRGSTRRKKRGEDEAEKEKEVIYGEGKVTIRAGMIEI